MSTKLTLDTANALLPQIMTVESTLSEVDYHIGLGSGLHGESFDRTTVERGDVAHVLDRLWDEMNDLCNAIAKALDSDGPSAHEPSRRDSARAPEERPVNDPTLHELHDVWKGK
jgi:hypothetical protein